MAKVDWDKLISDAEGSERARGNVKSKLQRENELRSAVRRTGVLMLCGIYVLAGTLLYPWVIKSPMFNCLGAALCLAGLCLCWLAGGFLWLLSGLSGVCSWAWEALPFASQPLRSVIGCGAFMLIVLSLWGEFAKFWNRGERELRLRRLLFRIVAGAAWLAVIIVIVSRFSWRCSVAWEAFLTLISI